MNDGVVNIRGKSYKTVALRVSEFRDEKAAWTLATEIVNMSDDFVIMRATISDETGRVIATGHAEEFRAASQINRTSALENAETSAIGRALAALGYGGSEFASANEVQNAIHQQDSKPAPKITKKEKDTVLEQTRAALESADSLALKEIWDEWEADEKVVLWKMFNSAERSLMKDMMKEAG